MLDADSDLAGDASKRNMTRRMEGTSSDDDKQSADDDAIRLP